MGNIYKCEEVTNITYLTASEEGMSRQILLHGQERMFEGSYKYLGYHMHEYLSDACAAGRLTSSEHRAFGKTIRKN